jgi:hypothetical protein
MKRTCNLFLFVSANNEKVFQNEMTNLKRLNLSFLTSQKLTVLTVLMDSTQMCLSKLILLCVKKILNTLKNNAKIW